MSDNLSQATFEVIWDEIMGNTENDIVDTGTTLSNPVTEMTNEEFFNMLGVDASEFDIEMDAENQFESTTTPSNNENQNSVQKDWFEDLTINEVRQKILDAENKNTLKKTLQDVSKFRRFLKNKHETRAIHEIPAEILDELLANFILSIKKIDGSEYEPTTIRNIVSSIDRHLKRHKYPVRIMQESSTTYFQLSRDALAAKQKKFEKDGKGEQTKCSRSHHRRGN